ncbi:MAG TPA: hypothetical protein VH765_04215 [Xanthobacteraceae bacterium]|jgi:hypothetical protein
MRVRFILLAAIAVGIELAPAAAVGCEVYRRPIPLGRDVSIEMIAQSGKDCRIRLRRDDVFEVETYELSARPLHGGARVQAPYIAYYRSNPDYRGRDHFIFTLCGGHAGEAGCTSIYVKVTVR